MSQEGERLQKVLAAAGIGSRREVESLISAGRVVVNGRVAVLGRRIDSSKDLVEVDGSRVPLDTRLVSYLLNKPRGVITTARDPQGRPSVLDLVELPQRVWPVGRLDADTEGACESLRERVGHPVVRLARTAIGPLMLGHLRTGSVRRLGAEEVRSLYRACEM